MIVLIANLGSTSFKGKLFDMPAERLLAVSAADRIGQAQSNWSVTVCDQTRKGTCDLADHAAAIELHLEQMIQLRAIETVEDVQAIGFKAVHGGPIKTPVRVDDQVLETMHQFTHFAPAHNPPYIAAMEAFRETLPEAPQVAAFETAFHQTIPLARQVYGIPYEWTEMGLRRYGFHGASHCSITARMAQVAPDVKKLISCHLGGSCSISAIRDGQSVANSFGLTAQSGVFHNNRVGDFDVFAILGLTKAGLDLDTVFSRLSKEGGLLGISGVSQDLRDIEDAAANGNDRARLAVDAFVESCRHYVGAYMAVLNGTEAIVFTGGIGQHSESIRAAICADMDYAGIELDHQRNISVSGDGDERIEAPASRSQIWVIPSNEELIVARQTFEVLAA